MNENKELKFCAIGEKSFVPSVIEKIRTGYGYVSYGDDNQLPTFLYNNYEQSSILQSIINGTTDFVMGESVSYNEDLIKKIVIDYLIFGGFAIQTVYKNNELVKIYWCDFLKCRKSADEREILYSDKWGQYGKKYITFRAWEEGPKNGSYIYYFKGHKTRGIYPVPMWIGALRSVVTSVEIGKFHLNSIMNGFNSNFIINFNNGQPDDNTQKEIEKQLIEKFTGSENAGKFLLAFNDDTEHAVTVERIASDDFDAKYHTLYDSVVRDIFISFRATPNLFGLMTETTGFNSQEFKEAFELYNKGVVQPIQKDITRVFKIVGQDIEFVPYKIYEE